MKMITIYYSSTYEKNNNVTFVLSQFKDLVRGYSILTKVNNYISIINLDKNCLNIHYATIKKYNLHETTEIKID